MFSSNIQTKTGLLFAVRCTGFAVRVSVQNSLYRITLGYKDRGSIFNHVCHLVHGMWTTLKVSFQRGSKHDAFLCISCAFEEFRPRIIEVRTTHAMKLELQRMFEHSNIIRLRFSRTNFFHEQTFFWRPLVCFWCTHCGAKPRARAWEPCTNGATLEVLRWR